MTSVSSLSINHAVQSLHQSDDFCRRRRRQPQHSGLGGTCLMTAAVAALSMRLSGAARQGRHDGRPTPQRPSRGQRRHIYDPLNTTKIGFSPLLLGRYRWLRQSPALARLMDENFENIPNSHQNSDVLGDGGGDSGGRGQGGRLLDAAYDDAYVYYDDANVVYYYDDAGAAADDAAQDDDDDDAPVDDDDGYTDVNVCEDKTCTVNEQCTKFLFGFLEGTTDAKDNCEGIMNAYLAADCGTIRKKEAGGSKGDTTIYNMDDDFNDDYFGIFYDHQCCSSLRSHYYEYCDSTEMLNGYNLLVIAGVMLLCECAKSVVKKNRIRWLPEAAACMLVGMAVALGAGLLGTNVENIGFDEEIFMYLLLPPIIFEAALTVNKREFRRRRGAIMVFAVFGTLLSSFVTGAATYYSAKYFGDLSLSILDSLVFGSLISSIDPVAILSVLTSLKMSETDTIYILVFGESLLNDGIAITLFKSLLKQYESTSTISVDDILGSIADFLIIAFGSCAIGLACGVACLCYFHLNSSILHPVMEVASFFLWAVVPYWMAEAFSWSGIVAIVVMGFFMDIYLRPGWDPAELELEEEERRQFLLATGGSGVGAPLGLAAVRNSKIDLRYYNWDDDDGPGRGFRFRGTAVDIPRPVSAPPPPPHPPTEVLSDLDGSLGSRTGKAGNLGGNGSGGNGDADTVAGTSMNTTNPNIKAILLKREFVRMSREADEHVRFVAHILSSLSENAIFAYLGLFLFSSKYMWDFVLCSIGVTACILSRSIMVVAASWVIWYMHVFRQRAGCHSNRVSNCIDDDLASGPSKDSKFSAKDTAESSSEEAEGEGGNTVDPLNTPISKSARALSNYKVQVVLILAGLRGAVSLALVESVPIYNGVTGVGSKNKPLLKAMTSSAIIFTIFVLGGGAYYILNWLDISSDDMLIKSSGRTAHRGSYGGYLYPPLVCGGYASGGDYAPPEMEHADLEHVELERAEMELSTSPSWRARCYPPDAMEPTPRVGTVFTPPSPAMVIARSRSDWSHTSGTSAGLNDIVDQQLPQALSGQSQVLSVQTDTVGPGSAEQNPASVPQVV